jgi:HD-GYP domain-containing protein (c-di-GMP phosphodiesterase class II)
MTATSQRATIRIREGEELFGRLAVAVSDYRVFSEKHPRYLESCQSFVDALERFFADHPDERHVLFVQRGGQVYFRKVPLSQLAPPAIKLSRLLAAKKAEGLRFSHGSSLGALTCVIGGLYDFDPLSGADVTEAINRRIDAVGLKNRMGLFTDRELSSLESTGGLLVTEDELGGPGFTALLSLPSLAMPLELYRTLLTALHDLMGLVGSGHDPKVGPLQSAAEKIIEGVLRGEHNFLPLTTIEYGDHFTFNHSVNVCLLVTSALKPFLKNPEKLFQAGQAALLHDLGKSRLPEELLYSARVPAAIERAEIERHTSFGAEVLLDTPGISPMAVLAAFDHHRRPDGSGYPNVRGSRPIDIVTAVVAAADIFEALTAERPYKRRLSASEAFHIFTNLPEARGIETGIRLLFETLSPFPPGTFVELDTGDLAVVTRTRTRAPTRPVVQLVDASSASFALAPDEIDLSMPLPGGLPSPRILRTRTDFHGSEDNDPSKLDDREFAEDWRRRVEEGTLLVTEA